MNHSEEAVGKNKPEDNVDLSSPPCVGPPEHFKKPKNKAKRRGKRASSGKSKNSRMAPKRPLLEGAKVELASEVLSEGLRSEEKEEQKEQGAGGKPIQEINQSMVDQEADKKMWSEEEIKRLFMYYKVYGTKWSVLVKKFPGRTENDIKNKFYTTLKRVATRAQLEDPNRYTASFIKCKSNLLQFVDAAILYGQMLPSKRGRKRNSDRKLAEENAILFPPSKNLKTVPSPSVQPPVPATMPQQESKVQPIIVQHVIHPWVMPYCWQMPGVPLNNSTILSMGNPNNTMYVPQVQPGVPSQPQYVHMPSPYILPFKHS